MKALILSALIIFSSSAFSKNEERIYEKMTGEVIVLETPLFASPSDVAEIIDWKRKGQEIYIRRKGLSHSPHSNKYNSENLRGRKPEPFHIVPNNGYFETLSRNGRKAYIKADHVKLIYLDEREFLTKPNRWEHDPTDYRLEEPLVEEYPLFDPRRFRTVLSYAIGPQRKINYPYPSQIVGEDFGQRKGGNFYYMQKVDFDPYNRFYFGAGVTLFEATSRFSLLNGQFSTEKNRQLSFGPYFSYDAYRYKRVILTFAGGISLNYYRTTVSIQGSGDNVEDRNFSAFSFSPRLGSYISIKDTFPSSDFIFGAELQATHSFTLTSNQNNNINRNAWNLENDQIPYEIGAQFSIFAGFVSKY